MGILWQVTHHNHTGAVLQKKQTVKHTIQNIIAAWLACLLSGRCFILLSSPWPWLHTHTFFVLPRNNSSHNLWQHKEQLHRRLTPLRVQPKRFKQFWSFLRDKLLPSTLGTVSLDYEQSIFCSKICKQEYLSSKVARVEKARIRAKSLRILKWKRESSQSTISLEISLVIKHTLSSHITSVPLTIIGWDLKIFWKELKMAYLEESNPWSGNGSLYVSGKLPTYPSPRSTFCSKWN